ncbi:hypothetical protein SAMN05443572_10692 [Myxococcus fulvus]|uniref:Lipoprotein n=1 Tax=Myxococcus fulvus TaxID=33 RepID=A0A511T2T7_MYXFU|nr:hypothetical protein [Myxococcus fulvus]GEN08479.1 hypothetical protein MFU01_35160 [Myxococcus fulvus]SEU20074.1 hypothetical protein SAMN05443572_10692 [Myxococcus fulvus]
MNRLTRLSVCVAASLVACTERTATPASSPEDAGAPAAAVAPTQPVVPDSPPVAPGATGGAVDLTDAGTNDAGSGDAGALAQASGGTDCSAAKLKASTKAAPKPPLPPAVESMRTRIIAAARACDYAELGRLVDEKGKSVRFSFGPDEDAVAFWKQEEAKGEPTLARIVQVLELPYAQEGDLYYWPSVHITGFKTEKDVKMLAGVYPKAALESMRKELGSYLGLRVGIAKDGDWQLAVAGD